MTREEIKEHCKKQIEACEMWAKARGENPCGKIYEEHKIILELLEQEPCEMTAEEYRQRMIRAFHNADCGELVALVVLPTEKEFEHLEWLLEKHYKAKPVPCEDCISRQAVLNILFYKSDNNSEVRLSKELRHRIENLPPVTPQIKTGHWIKQEDGTYKCSNCKKYELWEGIYCASCGAKMVESQESEDKE